MIRESLSELQAGEKQSFLQPKVGTCRYTSGTVPVPYLALHNHHLPRLKIVTTRASMQEDSRAAHLQALTPNFSFIFAP